ncbi:hypothetical protein GWK47_023117 [Chionoecetes opilio]|uniref:Uncharacterized protein n=1 Tax=Chionoecetes opilio TaxID=41210 RepID=A0A8J4XRK3_CHIOP|nr:hypothetical protein GWK47_023117 [Chionoecetes opilio]
MATLGWVLMYHRWTGRRSPQSLALYNLSMDFPHSTKHKAKRGEGGVRARAAAVVAPRLTNTEYKASVSCQGHALPPPWRATVARVLPVITLWYKNGKHSGVGSWRTILIKQNNSVGDVPGCRGSHPAGRWRWRLSTCLNLRRFPHGSPARPRHSRGAAAGVKTVKSLKYKTSMCPAPTLHWGQVGRTQVKL